MRTLYADSNYSDQWHNSFVGILGIYCCPYTSAKGIGQLLCVFLTSLEKDQENDIWLAWLAALSNRN